MDKGKKKITKKVESSDDESSEEEERRDDKMMILGQFNDNMGSGFDDEQFEDNTRAERVKEESTLVHIRFQQRTTRKCITIVQGLPDDLDSKKILRAFKKQWCCNGTVTEHKTWGTILQLQGDRRRDVQKFFVEEGIASKEEIKMHGF